MIRAALAFGAMCLLLSSSAGAQTGDESAIRAIEAAQEAAWNAHDIAAYVQPMAPDVEFISATGHWWHGRDGVAHAMGAAFATLFSESRMHFDDVEVRPVTTDVAAAYVRWSMAGAKTPEGAATGPLSGVESQMLHKVGGRWQIVSAQDTLILGDHGAAAMAASPAPPPSSPPAPPKRCFLANSKGDCIIHKK